jgi:hypothetical protein
MAEAAIAMPIVVRDQRLDRRLLRHVRRERRQLRRAGGVRSA